MSKEPDRRSVATVCSPASLPQPYFEKDGITIYHGDCREILPALPMFDLLLTDPPYGIDDKISNGGGGHTKNKTKFHNRYKDGPRWDRIRPSSEAFRFMFERSKTQIICGANYFVEHLPVSRGWVFWDKQGDGMSSVNNELIFTSLDRSIATFSRCHGLDKGFMNKDGVLHPTQKPVALMRWLLALVPNAETVVDPFAGSATTLVAARLEGRKAVGIEIHEAYCEKAAKRFDQGVLF
jgi:site-specific DNA-methyltransferase (adenine-specific)